MLTREIMYRKLNSTLAALAVAIAVGAFLSSLAILEIHDLDAAALLSQKEAETRQKMAQLNDEMRKATLKLGFNLLIFPKDLNLRDWHTEDYASEYMPEEYVMRLADSGIVTVRHFLPSLQHKIEWPEIKRTVILVGTRGEVPNLHKDPRNPMVQPVPAGTIVLGHELQQSLGLDLGDAVHLMGRKFTVHKCHSERGSKDDITAWISLHEAQELLDKKGLINAILALKCLCAGSEDIAKLREKIGRILPNTQSVEVGTRVVARAEARLKLKKEAKAILEKEKESRLRLRSERERFAAIIVSLVMIACVVWISYLGFVNVKDRETEIGILRALGHRSGQIMLLFLAKSTISGLVGGSVGFLGGSLGGHYLGAVLTGSIAKMPSHGPIFRLRWFAAALVVSCTLTIIAGWFPALLAAQRDPAEILQKE